MEQKVENNIKKWNLQNANICVGVSGGSDSTALLHILCKLKNKYMYTIKVIHINHMLREESVLEQQFVTELCNSYKVPCKVYKCNINEYKKQYKITTEEAGRKIRYEKFLENFESGKKNYIAVAHNLEDQGETVLMRLFRGTGLKGLCGIPMKTDKVIRPLLNVSKANIEKYCLENNLHYKTDKSNFEQIYTRNKIRLTCIPYIEKNFNNKFNEKVFEMSEILKEENDFLEVETKKVFESLNESSNNVKLNIKKLKNTHIAIQRRVLMYSYNKVKGNQIDLHVTHINDILNLLNKESGKKISLPHSIEAKKSYDYLIISKINQKSKDYEYSIKEGQQIYIKEIDIYITWTNKIENNYYTKIFNCDNIKDVKIRNRRPKDVIYIKNVGHKKLKKYFIDKKIEKERRDNLPLIVCGNKVVDIMLENTKEVFIKGLEDN